MIPSNVIPNTLRSPGAMGLNFLLGTFELEAKVAEGRSDLMESNSTG